MQENMIAIGIGKKIKERRENLGITQEKIANEIGVAISTVQRYEKGTIRKIKLPVVEAIARSIGVSPDWLIGKSDELILVEEFLEQETMLPSPSGRRIGVAYDKATPPVKETVAVALKPWLDGNGFPAKTKTAPAKEPEADEPETTELPQYELSSAAGLGTYMDEVPSYEMRDVLLADVPEGAEMLIRISGDSMEPEYCDGDIVFVESAIALESGDIGIFVVDSFAYCKQLVITGHRRAVLRSMNESYEDIDLSQYAYCHTVGRVIGKLGEE